MCIRDSISQVTELVDKAKDGFATLNGAVDAAETVSYTHLKRPIKGAQARKG